MKQGITNTIFKIRRSKLYQRLKYFYLSRKPFLRYFFNKSKRDNILGEKPVFIYNHIPKCGGTSFNVILSDFFSVIYDYPPHELEFECHFDFLESLKVHEKEVPNYLALKPFQAMSGHYFYNEIFLSSRFKGIYDCPRVKLISFLRDPLTHRVSLYSFGIKKGHSYVKGIELEDYILHGNNYYSKILECDINNYKERLDNYFFIGIMEEFNRSIELLSEKLRMKVNRSIPNINRSNSEKFYGMLSEEIKQEFKSSNHLDYLIYEYSLELLNR
ncbi:sulfotransferase family 2 domain-containing protein [Cyclobacterium roseum]|uniref:sulfotransferase family 2 domain-containing protein n=1 Tax=Cyclobacterium roseum TaxID=2666137 RepID=UPI001391C8E8|nr:sulfotransferase family 2 domain-containing protein [Cyclobacterium roseum]